MDLITQHREGQGVIQGTSVAIMAVISAIVVDEVFPGFVWSCLSGPRCSTTKSFIARN